MEDRFRALLTKREIVFTRSPFVGVALNQDVATGVGSQVFRMGFKQRLIVIFDAVAVEIEVDAALGKRAIRIVEFVNRYRCNICGLAICGVSLSGSSFLVQLCS